MDLYPFVDSLNDLSSKYAIGSLQATRRRLKSLQRAPSSAIFGPQSTFSTYAFHLGGRTELQFNVGFERIGGSEVLRHGVAFSLQRGHSLPDITYMFPKVTRFNEFIACYAGDISDLRLWSFQNGVRSPDGYPSPIPTDWLQPESVICLGRHAPVENVDPHLVLSDFDRLLPLYTYVESSTLAFPELALVGSEPRWGAAWHERKRFTRSTLADHEVDIDLRHGLLQRALHGRLCNEFGEVNVAFEAPSGNGGLVDLMARDGASLYYYEVKTALSARACIRQALPQLLEYALWPGARPVAELVVAGEPELDANANEYLARLRREHDLPVSYRRITLDLESGVSINKQTRLHGV